MRADTGLGWYLVYFILGILFYIYILKIYFNYLKNNKLLSRKIPITKEKFLWGEEEYWSNNKKYIAKNVFLNKKSIIAKKYHKNTIKTIFVISGKLQLFAEKGFSSHDIILYPGEVYEIYPETQYSISAITSVRYIEISSYEINDNYSVKKRTI